MTKPDLLPCLHRHKKRGTLYEPIGAATVQSETDLIDGDLVYLYRDITNGALWARKHDEFFDGRFESVPDTRTPNKSAEVDLDAQDAFNVICDRLPGYQNAKNIVREALITPRHFDKAADCINEGRKKVISSGHLATGKGGDGPDDNTQIWQTIQSRQDQTQPAAPAQIDAGELERALMKADHPGHRLHLLMHPDDKPHFAVIVEAARAHLSKLSGGGK